MLSQSFETIKIFRAGQKGELDVQQAQEFICKICLMVQPIQNCYSVGCQHLFCKNCLISHVHEQISNYQLITCCQEGCKHIIDYSERSIYHALEFNTQKIVDSILSNYKRINQLKRCNTCNKGVLTQSIYEDKAVLMCTQCGQRFCYNCFKHYHKPTIACTSRQKMELPPNCQQCQKCLSIIQKQLGCAHMKCICGYQFCFECGFHWDHTHICEHKLPKRTGIAKVCCIITKVLFAVPLLIFVGFFFLAAVLAICGLSAMMAGVVFWQFIAKKYLFNKKSSKVNDVVQTENTNLQVIPKRKASNAEHQKNNNSCCDCLLFILWIVMLPVCLGVLGVIGLFLPLINICHSKEYVLKPSIIKDLLVEMQGWIYLYTVL